MMASSARKSAQIAFKSLKMAGVLAGSLFLIAILQPSVRAHLRDLLGVHSRTVLSTTTASFGAGGTQFRIVKVKTSQAIYLEFYKLAKDGSSKLFQRIAMRHAEDGYFSFHGRAANLLVEKLHKSGSPQVLAPSFDRDMIAHLNVYRFDNRSQRFIPVQ